MIRHRKSILYVGCRCYFSSQNVYDSSAMQSTPNGTKGSIFYPDAPPPSVEEIDGLNKFIYNKKRLLVISGAGLSTESGIPDYRSKGVGLYDRTNHKPMKHQHFIASSQGRQKYWARNYLGWQAFQIRRPNIAHQKLSELEKLRKAHWHVTQNVDGLHTEAGIQKLTELHGCMNRVVCLDCNAISHRTALQERMHEMNENWSADVRGVGPDADAFVNDKDVLNFQVPPCSACGGILKPDVVFFGDTVPLDTVKLVKQKVNDSDGVLVVGSSLQVWSGYRIILQAHQNLIPIAAINVGPTRADSMLFLKINALCTQVLSQIMV